MIFETPSTCTLRSAYTYFYVQFVLVTAEALFENAYKTYVSELTKS